MTEPADEPVDETETTYSVVELNSLVRDPLRRALPDEVWVRGEVQNLSRSSAGHTYFSLVEKAGRGDRVAGPARRARCSATTAGPSPGRWPRCPGAELGNDVEVRIRGRVTVYPPTGPLPAGDDRHRPGVHRRRDRRQPRAGAAGAGGRGSARRQRPGSSSPAVPLRVGLITSSGSAAYHDFVHELEVERVRVAGHGGRRAGAGRGGGAAHQVGARAAVAARRRRRRARARRRIARRPRRRSTPSWWRARSPRCRCRSSPASGTRPTAASPTRSRTHACKTPTACAQLLAARVRGVRRRARRRVAAGRGARPSTHGAGRARARRRRPAGAAERARRRRARAGAARAGARPRRGAGPPAHRRGGPPARRLRALGSPSSGAGRRATRTRARRTRARARDHRRSPVAASVAPARVARGRRARARSAPRARARLLHHPRRRRPRGPAGRPRRSPARSLVTELADGRVTSRVETHHGGTR